MYEVLIQGKWVQVSYLKAYTDGTAYYEGAHTTPANTGFGHARIGEWRKQRWS